MHCIYCWLQNFKILKWWSNNNNCRICVDHIDALVTKCVFLWYLLRITRCYPTSEVWKNLFESDLQSLKIVYIHFEYNWRRIITLRHKNCLEQNEEIVLAVWFTIVALRLKIIIIKGIQTLAPNRNTVYKVLSLLSLTLLNWSTLPQAELSPVLLLKTSKSISLKFCDIYNGITLEETIISKRFSRIDWLFYALALSLLNWATRLGARI